MSRRGCDRRPNEAKYAEDHQRLTQANAVNDETAYQDGKDVRETVNGLEEADVEIGETQLLLQDVSDRAKRIVRVIAAEHGQADKDQHQPAVKPAGLRTSGVVHQRSFPSRMNSGELTTEKSRRRALPFLTSAVSRTGGSGQRSALKRSTLPKKHQDG